ncbi:short chain dehydrogenase [Nocardioides baekrokdamisoli]|uniref:Short chain dehydrogenase n=1 Tax=Nocardioides baekrokdamisoli TaxID=1804624 RepID=A0A3G9ICY2_9ACTN|nr:short chain dehydrogenase [Nocardioides baekrokdamisoli]
MKSVDGALVLVTGAASGIGRAVASRSAAEGARLVLTDINAVELGRFAAELMAAGHDVVDATALDLSDHVVVRAWAERLTAEVGSMDVVMNVAGISSWGTISAMPHSTWRRIVDVNLMGPIAVLEYFVPPMIEARRGGQIVNVSSAAGIIGMPWHAAYSASKFGLRGVSEVLRFDLARHRIGVSLVCPGGVDTGLVRTIEIAGVDKASPRFLKLREGFRKHAVSPDRAAASILRGMKKNRFWVYTSTDIRLAHLLQRYFPPGYVLAMTILNRAANLALPAVKRAVRVEE